MSKVAIIMAEGCEEIEGLTVVDLLRRAKIEIDMVTLDAKKEVTGSHGITFLGDIRLEDMKPSEYDGVILPGGMPGTLHLGESEQVRQLLEEFAQKEKLVAAICAAPSVLGQCHLLAGKKATCYPGFEDKLIDATTTKNQVEIDGNIITSRGMGTAIAFGLSIVSYFKGEEEAKELQKSIIA